MTDNEKKLIDAALSGQHPHKETVAVAVERVTPETLEWLKEASRLAIIALGERKRAADTAFSEAGVPENLYSSSRYDLLRAMIGEPLANLTGE